MSLVDEKIRENQEFRRNYTKENSPYMRKKRLNREVFEKHEKRKKSEMELLMEGANKPEKPKRPWRRYV